MDRFTPLGIDWDSLRGELSPDLFDRLDRQRLPWLLSEVRGWRGAFGGNTTVTVSVSTRTVLPGEDAATVLYAPAALTVFAGDPLAGAAVDGRGVPGTEFTISPFDADGFAELAFGGLLAARLHWILFAGGVAAEDYSEEE